MKESSRFEPRRRARRRALQALYQWDMTGQDVTDIISQFTEEQEFSNVDRDFFVTLVKGVSRDQMDLAEKLQPFLDRPLKQLDITESVILRIAVYELLNHPEVPFQVVLDEAIDLARRFGAEQGHGFVNAVLDRAAHELRQVERTA